jgi:hypothetical protein
VGKTYARILGPADLIARLLSPTTVAASPIIINIFIIILLSETFSTVCRSFFRVQPLLYLLLLLPKTTTKTVFAVF